MGVSGSGASVAQGGLRTLLGVPALGAGLAGLARAGGEPDHDDQGAARAQARGAAARLADACLLATSLFVIGWVALVGSEYHRTDQSAGAFPLPAGPPGRELDPVG